MGPILRASDLCSVFSQNSDVEFSKEFLSNYYEIKKINELKSFLHPDAIKSLESDDELAVKIAVKSDEFISRWEKVSITYISSSVEKETLKVKFKISGLRLSRQAEEIQTVYLKKDKGTWKVYALA